MQLWIDLEATELRTMMEEVRDVHTKGAVCLENRLTQVESRKQIVEEEPQIVSVISVPLYWFIQSSSRWLAKMGFLLTFPWQLKMIRYYKSVAHRPVGVDYVYINFNKVGYRLPVACFFPNTSGADRLVGSRNHMNPQIFGPCARFL